MNSLLSEREDANFDELDRQLHESNARVTELESRDVLTERLQNQCKDLQQQTATQSEEIERLIKDKSGLERKVKSKTVRFASSEIQPPSESASAETTLREEAKEKDARISELTQILHELQTAQNLADIEFGHCKAVITQAEQVARTALGPDSEVSSILELVQELGTRLERTKVEFAALEEFASIDPGVGNVIRSKILHLVGETHQLYEDKLASEFELQQVIGNSDDRIRQLMGQIGTVNNGGPELSNALAHISELERQNAEAATARHTAMGLQSQMNAQIIRQTQEIADLKRAERDLQRNLDKQVALMARLRSECDMFIDFLNTYKIGSESDSVAMRVGCLDTKYKGLKSTQGDFAKELQGTWNVLKKYHFTMKDTQGTPFPSVLDCVTTLVAQVAEAQSEVSRVFGFNGHYNPEVHNIARGVHELRKNRDTAVNFLNKDRATLEERNGELFNLRKQMKRLRNPQPHRQTEIASQESTMLHTESEAVPPGQLSGTKRGADEYDQMNSEGTERRPQLAGKKLRLAQGDEGDQEDQGKDIKMIQGERMEESS